MNSLRTAPSSHRLLIVLAVVALLIACVASVSAGMEQSGPQYREYGASAPPPPMGMPGGYPSAPRGAMPGMAAKGMSGAPGGMPQQGNMILSPATAAAPEPPAPVTRVKTDVTLALVAKYPTDTDADLRRYEATFEGKYLIKNKKSDKVSLQVFFPFPTTADTLPDVAVLVDGEEPKNVDYSQRGVSWLLKFGADESHEITVKYRAFGTEDFVYVLDHNERMGELTFTASVTGTEHKPRLRPRECLQPSTPLTRNGDTYNVEWKYKDLVTTRDLILEIPPPFLGNDVAKASYGLTWAGIATVLLFGLVLFTAGWASGKTVGVGQFFLIVLALVLFYPLLFYVSRHLSVPWAFGIAFAVSSLLVLDTLRRGQGLWFALRYGAFGLVTLLGLFSAAALATKGAGTMVMIGSALLIWYAIRITPRIAKRQAEDRAAAAERTRPPTPPSSGPIFRLEDVAWPGEAPEPGPAAEGSVESDESDQPPMGEAAAPTAAVAAATVAPTPVEPVVEERQHFCAYCGGKVEEEFSFCPHCGKDARIAHECEHCGTQICLPCAHNYKYCPGCGAALPEVGEG